MFLFAFAESALCSAVLSSPSLHNCQTTKFIIDGRCHTPLVTCCRSVIDGRAASSIDGAGLKNGLSTGEELMSVAVGVSGNWYLISGTDVS